MIECKGTYYITDNCYIDFGNSHIVINRVENQQIKLSNRGKIVLFVLTQNEGEIVKKNDLVYDVFNIKPKLPENRNEIAQIDTLISRLRKIPIISKCIETEYGVGFVFTNIHTIPSLKTSYTKKNSKTHNAFYNCPFYENREDLIQELQQFAFAVRPVHVISGERGMGKTELAKEYANACIANGDNDKNKAYENVIFVSYSDNGLKDTVISLQCKGIRNKDDRYKMIISLLGKLKEPSLLIIDNVDLSTSNDLYELSDKSECYMDLLNTKCHILLTSKTDLSTCHAIKQTVIKPHDIKILVQLFFKIMFNIEEKDPITTNITIEKKITEYSKHKNNERNADYIRLVTNLIDNILKKNTYLVTLVAKLSQIKDPYNIVKALMSDNANSLDDTVSAYKDGGHQEDTIINLYYKLIKISGIIDTDNSVQLLYNLALLPTSGIDYDVFFNNSFKTDTRTQLKRAFGKLINNYYVFKNEGIIYIHPFIREILLTKINRFKHSYIQEYVDFITKNIDVTNYDPNLIDNLTRAVALYSSLKKIGQVSLSYAKLTAYIAYAYDIITNKQLAYQYGKHAIELLDQLDTSKLYKIDKLEKAKCLNQSGYSVLHNPCAEDRLFLALTAIHGAEKLLETEKANLNISEYMHIEFDKLLTKVHGNLGACCLASKDYEKALAYHIKTKEYRENLVISEPNDTNNIMLATAYKNIGTDYYYISISYNGEKKFDYLKSSYDYHMKASKMYEEVISVNHRNTIIAINRLVGTTIMLLNEYYNLHNENHNIYLPFENILDTLENFTHKTKNCLVYLRDMNIVTDEITNCIKNILDMLILIKSKSIFDNTILNNIIETVDIASSISDVDKAKVTECYDIINSITEVYKTKIKEVNKI